MKLDTKEFETKMQKTIEVYKESLSVIRAGRANTAVISKVMVDYYGVPTAITQMAEVKVTDPKTLVISPWDSTTLKSIEKAILASDVGITPMNDGKMIRLTFPQLTEERRKEIKKSIAKMNEEAKVAIRNVRRDLLSMVKEDDSMSDDYKARIEEDIQKEVEAGNNAFTSFFWLNNFCDISTFSSNIRSHNFVLIFSCSISNFLCLVRIFKFFCIRI